MKQDLLPPAVLADAMQDAIHVELPGARAAKATKVTIPVCKCGAPAMLGCDDWDNWTLAAGLAEDMAPTIDWNTK